MKKVSIIFIVIAVLLVTLGVGYLLFNDDLEKEKKSTNKTVEEDRDYKTIEQVEQDSLSVTSNPNNFSDLITKVGFQNPKCAVTEIDPSSETCTAFHNGYTNLDYQDAVAATYKSSMLNQFSMVLYFTEEDFELDNVINKSNLVLKNFFGTDVNKINVSAVMESLKKQMADDEPVATKDFKVGNYTEQINMQYVKGKKIYVLRYYIILSSEYHVG